MSPFTHSQFLQRVNQAVGLDLIYWLGFGGGRGRDPGVVPGTSIDPVSALQQLQKAKPELHAQYQAGLQRMGLDASQLPHVACDCTGFVSWALGVRYSPQDLPGGQMNTAAIVADARGLGLPGAPRQFMEVQSQEPGDLLVFAPSRQAGEGHGHVGVLVQDAAGAWQVVHCGPENYELPPLPGGTRSAIRATGRERFDEHQALTVRYLGFRD